MLLDRKRIIYICIAVGAVLIAALLGYVYRTKLIGVFDSAPVSEMDSRTELQIQEELGELIKTGNFDDCRKINNVYYETVCVNNIALALADEKLDVSYCQRIDNKLIPIIECERQVVMEKSIEREDIGMCDETSDSELREQCRTSFFIGLAFKKDDVRVCDMETTLDRRVECADTFLFQREFADNASGFDCSRFRGSDTRGDCAVFVKRDAIRDPSACESLRSSLFINYCMMRSLRR